MGTTISIDDNAHDILLWAKEQIRKTGFEKPSHSDAIRYLKIKKNWRQKP